MKFYLAYFSFLITCVSSYGQDIKGQVKDDNGLPLPEVNIVVKNKNIFAKTDFDGNFTINAETGDLIEFSFLGYDNLTLPAKQGMIVTLKESNQQLQEIVVIGYGTKKAGAITGSVVQIKANDIIKTPAQSAIQSIQGKAAGVNIVTNDEPGASPTIQIRGLGTLLGGRTPLYVIDGVEASSISNLSPNEIATMDILKDASSLAIYGQKGANGAIIITTKKGKVGKVKISYDSYFGVKQIQREVEMSDTNFYTYYNNVALGSTTYFNSSQPYNTKWLDEITSLGQVTNNFISLSGGNDTANYYLGYTNYAEKGILDGTEFKRNNINSRTQFKLLDDKLKITQSTNLAFTNSTPKPLSAFTNAYKQSPIVPVKFPNGRWGVPLRNPATGQIDINGSDRFNNVGNPVAQLFYTNEQNKSFSLLGSIMAELKVHKDITVTSSFGATYDVTKGFTYTPLADIFLSQNPTSTLESYEATFGPKTPLYNSLSQRRSESYIWNWDNFVTYNKDFGNHSITVLGGMSRTTKNNFENLSGNRFNVPEQSNYWSLNFSSNNTLIDPSQVVQNFRLTPVVSIAYFARAEYDYKDKYLLSVVMRREGTSVFQNSKKWGLFPAISAGWVISDEDFFKNIKTINSLKFRAGYGEVGNSNTGNATNNIVFNPGVNYTFGADQAIFPGSAVPYDVDPNLTWETMREFDFGIDFSMLNRRLTGSIEYYNRQSTDIILPVTIPRVLSSQSVYVNSGTVSNIGQELTLRWADEINDNFNYWIGANFSNNKNKLEKVDNSFFANFIGGDLGNGQFTKQVLVGEALGSFYVYQVTGFDGDGAFTYSDERVNAGSYIPTYTYGLSFGGGYKQFDFSVDTYGVGGNKIYNGKKAQRFGGENVEVEVLENFWLPNNTNATNPKPFNSVPRASTYYIEDGDYFRINNITVGYTFKQFYDKIDKIRLFVTAINPFIITKYSGYSPEVTGDPLGRAGIELDAYPTNRTFLIGLNASF
ncbi:SusC/RagA family TonB-linked outer membrane protein [Flavobacterium dankookense]|uniref:TonB-linked SusC/RagA family outer membrane protein n=1 Tax=Flavobacterium dankookense TaxID=706186 RepID=A0A4V3CS61_9FLAO|nr:SusC/RagA family TonB-linked outer membrane protein [Flavobacterium dankookense]TDP59392.1 TonB-linked SusC/RagA family outer membrane protein [Flavobacterium dankookense]